MSNSEALESFFRAAQEAAPTKPPWDGGRTRIVGRGTWGCAEWYRYYLCPSCRGPGQEVGMWHFYVDDPGRQTTEGDVMCGECGARRMAQHYGGLGEPARYAGASLTDFPDKIALPLARWPGKDAPHILIQGIPGSGKTHACFAVRAGLSKKKIGVRILNGPEAREAWIRADMFRSTMLDGWKRFHCLILDDISATTASDGWAEAIHELIDYKITNMMPLIITSACCVEEIGLKFGHAIGSRLRLFVPLVVGTTDRRAGAWKNSGLHKERGGR